MTLSEATNLISKCTIDLLSHLSQLILRKMCFIKVIVYYIKIPLPQKYLKKQNLIKIILKILTNPFYLSFIHSFIHSFKNTFKKTIKEKYEEQILEKISNLDDSSKLFLYSKLKTDIKLEDYLKLTKIVNNRQLLTKFRTVIIHQKLNQVDTRKFPDIKDSVKLVKYQMMRFIFFLQCQINNNLRNVLINNIEKYHANFDQLDSFSQVRIILIPNQEFLSSVVDCIKQSLELRK